MPQEKVVAGTLKECEPHDSSRSEDSNRHTSKRKFRLIPVKYHSSLEQCLKFKVNQSTLSLKRVSFLVEYHATSEI